jgi:hypothetical protein
MRAFHMAAAALLAASLPATALAGVDAGKACGDVGGLLVIRGKPIIGLTLTLLEPGDKRGLIPLNQVTTGYAGASANANGNKDNDPVPGAGNNPKKPDVKTGPILTPGNPPTVGSVGTRKVMASQFLGVSADAQANVAASLDMNNTGGILGATMFTSSDCSANAKGLGTASAAALDGTDPLVLDPLSQSTTAELQVNLLSNLAEDPTAAFGLYAFSSDGRSVTDSFDLQATSNIPGDKTLFDLKLSASTLATPFNVSLTGDASIVDPITQSDFSTPTGEPGLYLLNPDTSSFDVMFTIPSGSLGTGPNGPFGLALNMNFKGSVAIAPEPSTWAMMLVGFAGLGYAAFRRGAKRQAAGPA